MRLAEFASAQDQLELWKLISDAVWSKLGSPVQPQQPPPSPAPTAVRQPPLPKPRKKGIKAKKTVARKVTIPKPPPPKPVAKPKPLYPNKSHAAQPNPLKGKPRKPLQTGQQRVNSVNPSSPAANPSMATRGIAAMNATAQIPHSGNKPIQP